jgi:hypothetical protein
MPYRMAGIDVHKRRRCAAARVRPVQVFHKQELALLYGLHNSAPSPASPAVPLIFSLNLGCLMVQLGGGIGNVTTTTGLVETAMAYSRSRMLCAAARLGIADALGDESRSVGFLAENCQADDDALYRLLRTLASIDVTEETTPERPKPTNRD